MHILRKFNPAWYLFAILSVSLSRGQAAPSVPPNQASLPTIGASPFSRVVPPPPNYAYPNGQTYVFAVEWHLFNAGTARVSLGLDGGQQHATVVTVSAGVVNALYKVQDRFESFFDPRTFCSQRVSKHSEEGSHSRQTELHFDYPRGKSVFDEKNLKTGEQKHIEN